MGDLFGVAVSPFELDEWEQATGIKPDMCMVFEAWSRQRPLTDVLAKAKAAGHGSITVTWEPWEPTKTGLPNEEQGAVQSRFSHASILRGDHDDYIDTVARSFRDSGLKVFLRYGHEMNGNWYPWYHDPVAYVEAWRYLRHRIRSERGAWNVQMVWSPNPDLWRPTPADWLTRLLPYWPGASQVDLIGFTMIEFARDREYPVSLFRQRYRLIREVFAKPVLSPEVNVAYELALSWLDDLTDWVRSPTESPVALVLSQGDSRAQAAGGTGDLSWSVTSYAEGRAAVERLVRAMHDN